MEIDQNPAAKPAKTKKPASKTFPGIVLRLILVLVVGVVVGAVVYFAAVGWVPYLDQRIFQPLDENQGKIQELQGTQQALEHQVSSLLETLSANQSLIDQGVQSTIDSLDQGMIQLAEDIEYMQVAVNNNTYYGGTLYPAILATLSAEQTSNSMNLSALATAQMNSAGIFQEVELLRILDLLSQANQFILHNNYGLAENQLTIAQNKLKILEGNTSANQRVIILEMLNLIEQSSTDLPAQPSLAAEKLQLAWLLGINGFPKPASYDQSVTTTPTPNLTPSTTPTPTSN